MGAMRHSLLVASLRPDLDKWSSNTLAIYERIQYRSKRGISSASMSATQGKLGSPPWWVDYLRPMAISAQEFYSRLHCLLPVNGGRSRELATGRPGSNGVGRTGRRPKRMGVAGNGHPR